MSGTSTTYVFSGTVKSPSGLTATASQPFTVTSSGGGTSETGVFGCTLTGASNLPATIQAWEKLVEPIGCMKIYFQNNTNPPPTSVANASNHIQAAAQLGIPVVLCFEPNAQGTSSDPGPATLSAAAGTGSGTFTAGTYYWKITGLGLTGEGTPSNEVSATIASNGHCNLTWTALPNGITGVNVYRGTSAGNENVLVATLGAVTSYTDTGSAGTSKSPSGNWPGGADKPAQGTYASGHTGTIQGDLHDAVACVNGLTGTQSAGYNPLNVLAAVIIQEADNNHNIGSGSGYQLNSVDQYTYLYYQWYWAWKTLVPSVPLGCILTGYNNPYASATWGNTWIPGPTVLRPNDVQYTDFIMVDVYGTGYHNLKYTPYQNGPGNPPNKGDAGNLWDICDYMGIAAGWSESGNSAGGTDPGIAYMVPYLSSSSVTSGGTTYPGDPDNSVEAHFAYRIANALPCMPYMWYTATNSAGTSSVGPNGIFTASDYRIPCLQNIYNVLSGS